MRVEIGGVMTQKALSGDQIITDACARVVDSKRVDVAGSPSLKGATAVTVVVVHGRDVT